MLILSQTEMTNYIKENKPFIWNYKTLYEIKQLANEEYKLKKIGRSNRVLGITLRGRFIACDKDEALSWLGE
jgi:hypothetical protein